MNELLRKYKSLCEALLKQMEIWFVYNKLNYILTIHKEKYLVTTPLGCLVLPPLWVQGTLSSCQFYRASVEQGREYQYDW